MRITIDTKHDSPDEIKKMISYLNSLLLEKGHINISVNTENKTGDFNISSSNDSSAGMFGMFGDSKNSSGSQTSSDKSSENSSSDDSGSSQDDYGFEDLEPYH